MEQTKKVAEKMGVLPKLRLGNKKFNEQGKQIGVESTGAHTVRFISDSLIEGKDPLTGKPRQEMKYIVEENGQKYRWHVALYDKKTLQPSYLIERLMTIKEGEEAILEMKQAGAINYIDVRKIGGSSVLEEGMDVINYDEEVEVTDEDVKAATK